MHGEGSARFQDPVNFAQGDFRDFQMLEGISGTYEFERIIFKWQFPGISDNISPGFVVYIYFRLSDNIQANREFGARLFLYQYIGSSPDIKPVRFFGYILEYDIGI